MLQKDDNLQVCKDNMFKWLNDLYSERQKFWQDQGIQIGDFVCLTNYCNDVWFTVNTVFQDYMSVSCPGLGIVLGYQIKALHRKNDPWDYRECRILDNTPVQNYQGTFAVVPWLWNYCGRNVHPKNPLSITPFLQKHKLSGHGLSWEQFLKTKLILGSSRIGGWHPIVDCAPEIIYDRSIWWKNDYMSNELPAKQS